MKLTLKAKHSNGKKEVILPVKNKVDEPIDEGSNDQADGEEDSEEEAEENDENDNFDEKEEVDISDEEGAVGFADAMSKVLNQNVDTEKAPILAKRVTSQMREISKEKAKTNATKLSAKEKRAREEKDMVIPSHLTMVSDKSYRAIATKGVVALFNAIAKHQHGQHGDSSKEIKSLSKDSFLGLLKQQGKKTTQVEKEEEKSTWSVVQDDYMMDAKLKDWGKDDEEGNADEDLWNVQEQLDSDNESKKDKKKMKTSGKPIKKGGKSTKKLRTK